MVYGDTVPVEYVKKHLPHLIVGSSSALKSCLIGYIATGWFGRVPETCRGRLMMVPANIAPWLWGWPNRFLDRMKQADSQVFILGDYDGGNFSSGIDTAADVARLPPQLQWRHLDQPDRRHCAEVALGPEFCSDNPHAPVRPPRLAIVPALDPAGCMLSA